MPPMLNNIPLVKAASKELTKSRRRYAEQTTEAELNPPQRPEKL